MVRVEVLWHGAEDVQCMSVCVKEAQGSIICVHMWTKGGGVCRCLEWTSNCVEMSGDRVGLKEGGGRDGWRRTD